MNVTYLHTKLRVRSLDAAIAFYTHVFGYAVRTRRPGPEESEIAFLFLSGQSAELQLAQMPWDDAYDVSPRLMHLAFKVDDCHAIQAHALAAGAHAISGPYTLPSGSVVAFVRDPDGFEIELVQKP